MVTSVYHIVCIVCDGKRIRSPNATGATHPRGGGMKQHKFWAYAMVFCAVMAVWTGRKHA